METIPERMGNAYEAILRGSGTHGTSIWRWLGTVAVTDTGARDITGSGGIFPDHGLRALRCRQSFC